MSTARQAGCAAFCAVVLGTSALAASSLPPAVAKIEARYFGVLERGPSWRIDGDRLTLSAAGDTLTFKRAPRK